MRPHIIPFFKFKTLFLSIFFTILTLCARLFYLQIILSKSFYTKGQKNFLRTEKIPPTRGNILDTHGNPIATNRPIHNLYWQGTGKHSLREKQKNVLQTIGKILGNDTITKDETVIQNIKYAEKSHKKILIKSDITFDQLSKIEEQFPHKKSILISTSFKRFYPYQSFASHLLGYLGRINLEPGGKMGLEKIFEDTLKGKNGSLIKTINSFGKQLSETTIEQAFAGRNIKTTLDIDMQKILEDIFPTNETGTCILMNPKDGAILALASKPNFDPNIFLSPITKKDWSNLQENHPFLNRALNACYPPGSIFKLVTTSAALEAGILDKDQTWECKGYVTFVGRRYLCHKLQGHGALTASQALEQSCNTFFYDLAQKIDIDLLADYAKRFGLGEKTNIILPEKRGVVPSRQWKLDNRGERWFKGETLSASIGQSFLTTTPLQIARMISSIFTGYLVNPRILKQEPVITQPLAIEPKTLEFLKQSMKKVVTQGTGKNISRITDWEEIYAKTSTAQTSALHKRRLGHKYREHRWFVLYFRYKNNEPLTMVTLIEHSESARSAKNTAKRFLISYKRLIDKKKSLMYN